MIKILKVLVITFIFLIFSTTTFADKIELNLSHGEIAYTFFDLEHGEATLIQDSTGKTILVNTGHKESEEELKDRLKMYDVDEIDTIILTSKQQEYIGNLSSLVSSYPVNKIVIPESLKKQVHSVKYVNDDTISYVNEGDSFELLPDLVFQVLFIEKKLGIDQGALSFFLIHKDQKLLYLTEANQTVEQKLVEKYDLKTTVMKVPDFGSELGTTEKLLEEADPQVAVIFKNGDHPPSNYVLERLNETWIDIYQTSRSGTVTIKCLEDDYEIITVYPQEKDTLLGWLL
ncbi:ComEC/Rec2 family competence protein [Evansella halocellulosilytica]|uniref:ComEC/Rec2 family competence protein n=1 Tax=Evansella halocellulosilytica TaxID=2011013 RepID=UPI000BB762F5|nr:hypothetical protein [Evansella halocellulosilytica]